MQFMAALSRLTAVLLGVLVDSPKGGLTEAHESLEAFRGISSQVERHWVASKLSAIQNEEYIGDHTFPSLPRVTSPHLAHSTAQEKKDIFKSVWVVLKTLLFTTIMIADGVLASVVYASSPPTYNASTNPVLPYMVAQSVLRTLSRLSFVVSEFGGVTAGETDNESGFAELRKVFYLAIDIFCSREDIELANGTENWSEAFARELVDDLRSFNGNFPPLSLPLFIQGSSRFSSENGDVAEPLRHAKAAYVLACIEQLVPVIREPCLKDCVWNVCAPSVLTFFSSPEIYR